MSDQVKKGRGKGITRRDFIKKTGVAGAALGAAAVAPRLVKEAFAAKRDYILIGHPNPSTGGIAPFGEPSPWVNQKACDAINAQGGIYIKEAGKKLPVKFKVMDTESSPTKAAEVAAKLILQDKVDVMLAISTPDTSNPVSAMCERYEVPCMGSDAPIEPWLTGGPYKWTFFHHFTFTDVTDLFIGMWDQFADKTNKKVGFLFPNDPDGVVWADNFNKGLPAREYQVIDPGRFPYGQQDYTSFISLFKKQNADIVTGCVIPPDWATFWRQCHQQGYVPKIATIGKALLFPPAVEAIGGDLALGLTCEIQWTPYHPYKSSLTGETPRQLCDKWEKETGKQWTNPMGAKYACFEVVFDALKRAETLDKKAVREALAKTDLDTIYSHISFNKEHYSVSPLVGIQWVKGKKWKWELEIVYNKENPFIPKTADMIFPLPKFS